MAGHGETTGDPTDGPLPVAGPWVSMDAVRTLATDLLGEARATDERRLLVLHGERADCERAAGALLDVVQEVAGVDTDAGVVLAASTELPVQQLPPSRSGDLLGETYPVTVVDCHDECRPNALGRVAGTVDGGGLLVVLAPPLERWPDRRDGFDEGLAAPPFGLDEVAGNFRRRLVRTLREHPGVAVVAVGTDPDGTMAPAVEIERDGLTDPPARVPAFEYPDPEAWRSPGSGDEQAATADPSGDEFDTAVDACLTDDQRRAVAACAGLREPGRAIVLTADRGRGKSSAIGLAAGALALAGRDVLVTAPGYPNAREVFARAEELLGDNDALADTEAAEGTDPRGVSAMGGGRVRFADPARAVDLTETSADGPDSAGADVLLVDEAAALPVRLLERLLAGNRSVAFATTVHGYEGAGRGFDVRFRDRLAADDRTVTNVRLDDPIRYAAGDPVEAWLFRALMLGARPPVEGLVADATPETVTYRRLDPTDLVEPGQEWLLREAFGLLVLAHYRTEPDDLARLLDAPNVAVRALCHDGHPVAVALLAREGGLDADRCRRMYEGERVRGNMLPDVLTTQLRDAAAGEPVGVRVLRIATHHAVRSQGLGSKLLDGVAAEFGDAATPDALDTPTPEWNGDRVDWLGVGYGATPDLLRFWRRNGYRMAHLSTSRNETSGEYSALMLRPCSPAGRALHDRTANWFARRIGSVLGDPLRDADPDVVRGALRAAATPTPLALTDREWRTIAAAAFGPGLYAPAPRPFRALALHYLTGGEPEAEAVPDLPASDERLLVRKALQARSWDDVAADLAFVSRRACMRQFGAAMATLVDAYGNDAAREEGARYR